MTRLLVVLAIIVVLPTSAVFALELDGTVTLYADAAGTDCNIVAPTSGLVYVYVFFVNASRGATAILFSAPGPPCLGAIFIADNSPFLWLGDSQTGIQISFGTCRSTPIHMLTMLYLAVGPTASCCPYPVQPYPGEDQIWFVDCSSDPQIFYAGGDIAVINQNETCPCTFPVPVEETTWGAIKAQYK